MLESLEIDSVKMWFMVNNFVGYKGRVSYNVGLIGYLCGERMKLDFFFVKN